MTFIDIFLIFFIFLALLRGIQAGALHQAGSFGGFLLGLAAGIATAKLIVSLRIIPGFQPIHTFAVVMLWGFVGGSLGEILASYIERGIEIIKLGFLNRLLGGVIGVSVTCISIWLVAALVAGIPATSAALANSRVITVINQHFPPVPPQVIQVGKIIDKNLFPRVFEQEEPQPIITLEKPTESEISQAVAKVQPSMAKISGVGCGGIVFGSGFVVNSEVVATNAHVIAGLPAVTVQVGRQNLRGTPIYFNPNLDFALIKVPGLKAEPLPFANELAKPGTKGVAVGFPGGGDFTASPSSVIDEVRAVGRTIYDDGVSRRHVYRLQVSVRPDNSGGPLVLPDGRVIGVIFAASTTSNTVGYALAQSEVMPLVAQYARSSTKVSTQRCVE